MNKKLLIVSVALALVACFAVGITIAYLTDTTQTVTNTFTVGKVDIELNETTGSDYQMIPGSTLAKDPKVTVKANSEDCWVFIKVDETNNPSHYLTYTIDSGWTALGASYPGVYYREYTKNPADQVYDVLTGNEVVVISTLTNDDMATAEASVPTIAFTAYAIQKANTGTAAEAWAANFAS